MGMSVSPRFGTIYVRDPGAGKEQWHVAEPRGTDTPLTPKALNNRLLLDKGPRLRVALSADAFQRKGKSPVASQKPIDMILTGEDAQTMQADFLDKQPHASATDFPKLFPPVLKALLSGTPVQIDNPGFLQAFALEQDELLPQNAIRRR